MKKIVLLIFALSSPAAFGANVLYCGGLNIEGSYLKVDPAKKIMCISAGPWGADYCSNASKSFIISEARTGSVTINEKDFTFREFIGSSSSGVQLVRMFNEASNPSGADTVVHRADLAGPYLLINVGVPNVEAKDGEATCIEGDDFSF